MTNESELHRLPQREHQRIFDAQILPHARQGVAAAAQPTATFVGGQPGAGNAALRTAVAAELATEGTPLHVVVGALRPHHPALAGLLAADDKCAELHTTPDAEAWAEQLVRHGCEARYPLLIEGFLCRPELLTAALLGLREAGYRLELRVLAVPAAWSLLGTQLRYERARAAGQARCFTLYARHVTAYRALATALAGVEEERLAHRLRVVARNHAPLFDADERGALGAAAKLEAERARPFTPAEKLALAVGWMEVWAHKRARAAERAEFETVRARLHRALFDLHTDADAVVLAQRELAPEAFAETARIADAVARSRERAAP